MAGRESNSDNGIEVIKALAEGLANDFEIITQNNNSAAARLVWFVAIAGFSLLNVSNLANSIVGMPLEKYELVGLVFPWALAGFSGIVAHWLNGEVRAKDNAYYIIKQHSIRAWLVTAPKKPSTKEVLDIVNVDSTDEEVSKRKSEVDKINPSAQWWENATFAILIFSFAWSVLLPFGILIFNTCTGK